MALLLTMVMRVATSFDQMRSCVRGFRKRRLPQCAVRRELSFGREALGLGFCSFLASSTWTR